MAHDDDKPENGDDPWAGLESAGPPEFDAEFAFSLDEGEGQVVEREADEATGPTATDAAAAASPGDSDEPATGVADVAAAAAADAEIGDWLSEVADGDAAASSVLGAGAFGEREVADGGLPDFLAGESSVNIGTGTSGILSPSGIDAAGGDEPDASAEGADPFAGLTAEPLEWASADPTTSVAHQADGEGLEPESADDFGGAFDLAAATVAGGAAVAAGSGDAEPKRAASAAKRSAPPRKKKPSMIGQLIGVVLGGAMAIPVTLGILIWGFGKDPFNLTPMLPDSVAFLVPAKFRPAGASVGLPRAPSLDSLVDPPPADNAAAADGSGFALPSVDDLVVPEPDPAALAVVEPAPSTGDGETAADPLMNLLDDPDLSAPPPAAVAPAAPPEPEPLDLEKLGALITEAQAALEAVTAVDDPSDPVRRRLLAKWYRALAAYAEELAAVERLAAETGRPFEPAVEQGEAIRDGLAGQPRLLAELSQLTRDWLAYAKRSSDGVVMPGTFVLARRVGPYWRSRVSLAATDKSPVREMVVLTRAEPAVAPGDEVVIVGLAVDDDVVWASELRPAGSGTGFPGL